MQARLGKLMPDATRTIKRELGMMQAVRLGSKLWGAYVTSPRPRSWVKCSQQD